MGLWGGEWGGGYGFVEREKGGEWDLGFWKGREERMRDEGRGRGWMDGDGGSMEERMEGGGEGGEVGLRRGAEFGGGRGNDARKVGLDGTVLGFHAGVIWING